MESSIELRIYGLYGVITARTVLRRKRVCFRAKEKGVLQLFSSEYCVYTCVPNSQSLTCSFDSRPARKLVEMTSFFTIIQKIAAHNYTRSLKFSTRLSPVDLAALEESKGQQQTTHMHTCGHSGLISGLLAARGVTVFNICCHV